jgi:hypothetical protein
MEILREILDLFGVRLGLLFCVSIVSCSRHGRTIISTTNTNAIVLE